MAQNKFTLIQSPGTFKKRYPLTPEDELFIHNSRAAICNILCTDDPRLVIVLGPCSIHNEESALEYASRIRAIQERVKDNILLVMRFYFEKPRTKTGWKGLLYDPYINGTDELEEGINICRRLMKQITEMRVPLACEIVDPLCFYYFDDIISWLCIGARTSSSQVHRQNVSGMLFPVGFKNDLSGNVSHAIDSVIAADTPHTFLAIGDEGKVGIFKSAGAPFAHLVLRGAKGKPNYHQENIQAVLAQLEEAGLMSSLFVDCSHDNCNKRHETMPDVFEEVLQEFTSGITCIRGMMLESHLLPGNQPMVYDKSKLHPQISITDPCIGWDTTEALIDRAHQALEQMTHAGV